MYIIVSFLFRLSYLLTWFDTFYIDSETYPVKHRNKYPTNKQIKNKLVYSSSSVSNTFSFRKPAT